MSDHPVIDSLEASRPANSGRRMSFGGSTALDEALREANSNNNNNNNNTHNHLLSDHLLPPKGSVASLSPRSHSPVAAPSPSSSSSTTAYSTDTKPAATAVTSPRMLPNEGWQPMRSKSSNYVHPTQRSAAAEQLAFELIDSRHGSSIHQDQPPLSPPSSQQQQQQQQQQQHEHDKPSVLPKILPGLQERLADVHQASLRSVANVPTTNGNGGASSNAASAGGHSPAVSATWTGGTMFPVSPPAMGISLSHDPTAASLGRHPAATHHLAKSSILYESADVPLLSEEGGGTGTGDQGFWSRPPQQQQLHHQLLLQQQLLQQQQQLQQQLQQSSNTLVQGGSGGRRWSHELSPEKAGLVGSVLEAAGLIKDVVLDKVTHHGPGSTIESSDDSTILFSEQQRQQHQQQEQQQQKNHQNHKLTDHDKEAAARAAFGGGSDETGDQNVYYSGLKTTPGAAAAATEAAETTTTTTTAMATTPGYGVQDLLASAPQAGQAHHRSKFVLHEAASNPEVYKGLLLHHPEKLGYHSRDPDWVGPVVSEDPVLARLGVVAAGPGNHAAASASAAVGGGGGGVMTNADDRREQQK